MVEIEVMLTTAVADVAVTPSVDKCESALIAVFRPVAMVVSVSVESTVYGTDSCPPLRAGSCTTRVSTSPVVFEPAMLAFSTPFLKMPKFIVSVAPPLVDSV